MLHLLSWCQPRMKHISSHLSAIHQEVEAGLDEVRTYCHHIASNLTNYSSQLGLDCAEYSSSKSLIVLQNGVGLTPLQFYKI